MSNVIDFDAAIARRNSAADAHAFFQAWRLRVACNRIAAVIGGLSVDDGVRLGHELDTAIVDELETLVARLES